MITIYFPGHGSHFDGKFTDPEIEAGLEHLRTRYSRPPFSCAKIVILREPGKLNCTGEVDDSYPNPKLGEKRRKELLEFDVAYCEEWRVKRVEEMVEFMLASRQPGAPAEAKPASDK
jgi:hypothetical protein